MGRGGTLVTFPLRASVQTRIDYLDRLSTEAKEGAFIHSNVQLLDLNDFISDLSILSLGSGAANSVSCWRVRHQYQVCTLLALKSGTLELADSVTMWEFNL